MSYIDAVRAQQGCEKIKVASQQVGHGCLHRDGGASAQDLRYRIRPEKGIVGLAEKLATETGEPIKKHFAKVLHQAG